jgi:hypothetical protein
MNGCNLEFYSYAVFSGGTKLYSILVLLLKEHKDKITDILT